jgi:branched-chain amino acid transport system permease protein
MRIRAGESDREMIGALGVDIRTLYTVVFALRRRCLPASQARWWARCSRCRSAWATPVLILAFVVIVIGGIGSIRGAFVGALLVGLVDTMGRIFLPQLLTALLGPAQAASLGGALSSMLIYIVMAAILAFRPKGLFAAGA